MPGYWKISTRALGAMMFVLAAALFASNSDAKVIDQTVSKYCNAGPGKSCDKQDVTFHNPSPHDDAVVGTILGYCGTEASHTASKGASCSSKNAFIDCKSESTAGTHGCICNKDQDGGSYTGKIGIQC